MRRSVADQVKSGAKLGVAFVLIFCWVGLTAFAVGAVFSDSQKSRALGWLCLFIAAVIAILTVDRWVKALPVALGMAVLNGWISVWNGYTGVNPENRIPRLPSAMIVLVLVACNFLAIAIAARKLTVIDRAALFAFLVAFGFAISSFPSAKGFILMFSCLAVAWGNDRMQRYRLKKAGKPLPA